MPNGDDKHENVEAWYSPKWCNERHERINCAFKEVKSKHEKDIDLIWQQMRRQGNMLWGVLGLLFINLGGVLTILLKQVT